MDVDFSGTLGAAASSRYLAFSPTHAAATILHVAPATGEWAVLGPVGLPDGWFGIGLGEPGVAVGGSVILAGAPLAGNDGEAAIFEDAITGSVAPFIINQGALSEPNPAVSNGYFGSDVDVRGDELFVGALASGSASDKAGRVFVYSRPPCTDGLYPLSQAVSLAAPDPVDLILSAGLEHGSRIYLVLGSANGTAPGIGVDGVVLPLNFDGYLVYTLQHPNVPPLAGTLGVLDALGHGLAAIQVPAGLDPALAGTQLHHAYLVFDEAGAAAYASAPAPLTLVP